jgi:hypothetical protein
MKPSILFLSLAIASHALAQSAPSNPPPTVLKSEVGRFVFGQISAMRADQFMLDTQTGRLWQIVVDKEGRQKLQAVPYLGIWMGEESYVPDSEEEVASHRQMARQLAAKQFQEAIDDPATQSK